MRLPAYYTIPLFICLCSLTGCADPHEEAYQQILIDVQKVADSGNTDVEAMERAKTAALKIQSEDPDWRASDGTTIKAYMFAIEAMEGFVNATTKSKKAIDDYNREIDRINGN